LRFLSLIALAVLALALFGCSSSIDLEAQPDLRLGEDVCEQCGMIISEEAFAAAIRLNDGKQLLFDDIGDMVTYFRLKGGDVAVFWIHDYTTRTWVHADNAYYVASNDLVTPMGHGITGFALETNADALVADIGGVVHTWDDLLAQPLTELDRDSHHMDGMSGMDGMDGMSMGSK
jgi:copper chaperone NosL